MDSGSQMFYYSIPNAHLSHTHKIKLLTKIVGCFSFLYFLNLKKEKSWCGDPHLLFQKFNRVVIFYALVFIVFEVSAPHTYVVHISKAEQET